MTNLQKRGCVFLFLGAVLVSLSLGLHLVQQKQDQAAGETAQVLLQQLELNRVPVEMPDFSQTELVPNENDPVPERDITMPEKKYLGYTMIGTLTVPSVGIELPILSSWDYELLNIAPCRYTGSVGQENMILMGHNYKSHFGPLRQLEEGAQVEFEDVNGVVYHYTVAVIESLHKNEGELLPSKYPLTLFTCTPGGQKRVVIRCENQE